MATCCRALTIATASLLLASWGASECLASPLEQIIVIGNRAETSLADTAAALSSISEEELKAIDAEHIHQIFNRVAGAWVSRGNGQEHLTAIRSPVFTGAGGCGAFFMAEDGIPLRAPGFCNANQLFDSHFEAAESIEVFRGPNSALYGSNALFGGINILLPDARSNDGNAELSVRLAEYDYRRIQYDQTFLSVDNPLRVFITSSYDGGYRESSGYEQQKISIKHQWERENLRVTNNVTAANLEQETAGFIEGEDVYRNATLARSNPNPQAYRDARSMRVYSRWQWQLARGELDITPYARWNEMEFLMHFVPWQPIEKNGHHSAGTQIQWRRDLADSLGFFLGSDLEITEASLLEIQQAPSPFDPEQFPAGTHYDYLVTARNAAIYTGVKWQASDPLLIDAAIRYDHDRYEYDNRGGYGSACEENVQGCRFFRPADRADEFESSSARLAAVYNTVGAHYVYTGIGEAYRAPQAAELYRLEQGQNRADLVPVKLSSAELGLRGQARRLFYQLSLFSMIQRNGIFQNSERHYVSGAETSHKGVEYEFNWRVTDALLARLAGTYAEHQYENNPNLLETGAMLKGNDVDTAPRNMNAVSLNWQASINIETELELIRMGKYYTDPENSFSYEGHTLANLRGAWQAGEALRLSLSVTNLADTAYAERADVLFGEARYFPGERLKLTAGIQWAF
jgi:iron complex outermembrane receptor protein